MRLGLGKTDPKGQSQGRGEKAACERTVNLVRGLEGKLDFEALASGEGPSPRPWLGQAEGGAVSIRQASGPGLSGERGQPAAFP